MKSTILLSAIDKNFQIIGILLFFGEISAFLMRSCEELKKRKISLMNYRTPSEDFLPILSCYVFAPD